MHHSQGLASFELTDASGQRVVPLSQSIRDGFTLNGSGAVKRVAWVTLEHHRRAHGEVVANAFAETRLWNRAALCGTGPWYGYDRSVQQKHANLESFTSYRSVLFFSIYNEMALTVAQCFRGIIVAELYLIKNK